VSVCVYGLLENHRGNHHSNLQVGLERSGEDLAVVDEMTCSVKELVRIQN
jgi:hypothetical protein